MINIQNIDCLIGMKELADESIDCIISDVPYKIIAGGVRVVYENDECGGVLNKRDYSKTDPKGVLNRGRVVYDNCPIANKLVKKDGGTPSAVKAGKMFEHNDLQFSDWIPDMYRVLKKGTHCYLMVNGRNLKELQIEAEKAGFVFQNLLIWDKGNVTPNKYYMQGAEFILMLSKRPARNINNMGSSNILRVPNIIGTKVHPTEKPISLMEIMVLNSTSENEIVLDPFMGSGSTGIASKQHNRNFIGFEIDEEYFEIAKDRIEKENQVFLLMK